MFPSGLCSRDEKVVVRKMGRMKGGREGGRKGRKGCTDIRRRSWKCVAMKGGEG